MDSADRGHVVERACACMHAYVRGIDADVAKVERFEDSKQILYARALASLNYQYISICQIDLDLPRLSELMFLLNFMFVGYVRRRHHK